MLLRICLVVAILAGLGVIGVGQFKVKPHLQSIIDTRDTYKQNWDRAEKRARDLDKNLKETKSTLASTQQKLTETEGARAAAETKLGEEQKRATGLQSNLERTRTELATAQQNLEAWRNTGRTPQEIVALVDAEKQLRSRAEFLSTENDVLGKKVQRMTAELQRLTGTQEDPPLRPGTRGRILAVDPKWNFVVLDIGEKDELVPNGVLIVHRDGQLVAKLRIVSVQKDRSIANIIPGWKLNEVTEGDLVFY